LATGFEWLVVEPQGQFRFRGSAFTSVVYFDAVAWFPASGAVSEDHVDTFGEVLFGAVSGIAVGVNADDEVFGKTEGVPGVPDGAFDQAGRVVVDNPAQGHAVLVGACAADSRFRNGWRVGDRES